MSGDIEEDIPSVVNSTTSSSGVHMGARPRGPTRTPTPWPSRYPTIFPTSFPSWAPTQFPTTIHQNMPCFPGKHHDIETETCIPCNQGQYNHGGMPYLRDICYIVPKDSEYAYLNITDVKCKKEWWGDPIYQDGEYEEGCNDIPDEPTPSPVTPPSASPTAPPTPIPTFLPTFLPLPSSVTHLSSASIAGIGISGFFGLFGVYYLYTLLKRLCRRRNPRMLNAPEVAMIERRRDNQHLPPRDSLRAENTADS